MYHVGLALTTEQVKRLKQLALSRDLSVKDLVASLVVQAIVASPVKASQKTLKNIKEDKK